MKGKLFIIFSLLSLLLSVATLVFWARSLRRSYLLEWVHGSRAVFARTIRGGVEFGVSSELPGLPTFVWDVEDAPTGRGVWWPRTDIESPRAWLVQLPLWIPLATLLLLAYVMRLRS